MTEVDSKIMPRGSNIFGRETVSKNQLLKSLDVDGDGRVGMDEIVDFINQSKSKDQKIAWYKFAVLFGFIIIILQALTTFAVAIWANEMTKEIHATTGTMVTTSGEPIDATGQMPSMIEDMWEALQDGQSISFVEGTAINADDETDTIDFKFAVDSSVKQDEEYTMYGPNGITVTVTADDYIISGVPDTLRKNIGTGACFGDDCDDEEAGPDGRRRLKSKKRASEYSVSKKQQAARPTFAARSYSPAQKLEKRCDGAAVTKGWAGCDAKTMKNLNN